MENRIMTIEELDKQNLEISKRERARNNIVSNIIENALEKKLKEQEEEIVNKISNIIADSNKSQRIKYESMLNKVTKPTIKSLIKTWSVRAAIVIGVISILNYGGYALTGNEKLLFEIIFGAF